MKGKTSHRLCASCVHADKQTGYIVGCSLANWFHEKYLRVVNAVIDETCKDYKEAIAEAQKPA